MHLESGIDIARSRAEVFDYLARAEYLPQYAAEFAWVKQTSAGSPCLGTDYTYKMSRGTEGSFRRTVYEPHSKLAWHGPAAKAGPGTMAPSGSWELSDAESGTRVKLVMSPTPGGLLKLMSPVISRKIDRELPSALERLKQRLEADSRQVASAAMTKG